jgi:hypothetical protein
VRKDHAKYKTLVATSAILVAVLFAVSIKSSDARNDDVPSNWLSFRSDRLKQRDQLLSTKAEQVRCWNEDENTLKILDQGLQLQLSLADRKTLLAAREARMNCIGAHRAVMGNVDRAIIDVDKDLSYIESQITRVACQR